LSLSTWFAFLAASTVVMVVPGPAVTLIVANSMRHGRRAGFINIAGIQLGLALTVLVVLAGLASLIAAMGAWFVWVRLAGAVYLIWLGVRLFKASGETEADAPPRTPRGGFFLQGLAVAISNPKVLVFFGAFFPQFMDPGSNFVVQVLIMGATAMAVAATSDSVYVLLASRAGVALSRRQVQLMRRASGSILIGGGLWLALSRAK
jgi:threonine/homoserine/homoserine lactone efflux protein